MLEEYVALRIEDGGLCSLPQLVDGYVPPMLGLPLFVWRLATQVDWSQEQPCFEGITRQVRALTLNLALTLTLTLTLALTLTLTSSRPSTAWTT